MSVRQGLANECVRFHCMSTKRKRSYYVKNCSASLALKHANHGLFVGKLDVVICYLMLINSQIKEKFIYVNISEEIEFCEKIYLYINVFIVNKLYINICKRFVI